MPVDDALIRLLAGEPAESWAAELAADNELTCARIEYHGIAPLLLERAEQLAALPAEIVDYVRDQSRLQAMWEARHHKVTAELVEGLADVSLPSLLLKGAGLAYSVYRHPEMRRRSDTDLLVPEEQLREVRRALAALGWERTRNRQLLQESWSMQTREGFSHSLDLHWRALNAPALCGLFDNGTLFASAQPLPRFSPRALTLDPVRQFMLGSVNQRLHRKHGYFVANDRIESGARMIWAYDNHLLARGFSAEDWAMLVGQGEEKGLSPLLRDGLLEARRVFGTDVPAGTLASLGVGNSESWVSHYIDDASGVLKMRRDLAGVGTVKEKARVLLARVILPAGTLQERYPGRRNWPLPALHALRLSQLIARPLRRPVTR